MKNKRLLYVLLPAVVLVWGLIFYRIVGALSGNEAEEGRYVPLVPRPDEKGVPTDSFALLANYRDPFLGSMPAAQRPIGRSQSLPRPLPAAPAPAPVILEPVVWPEIMYLGIIQNRQTRSQVGLIRLAGQEHFVKEKEVLNGLKIERILKDSVQIRFGTERRFIRRN